ncbi:MAG: hypothetical protein EOO65_03920 [Methanosarcinales archaeon]|nr:MAG: hypothetical protein EOO65_03920 [Methanosarcinales archaeon]
MQADTGEEEHVLDAVALRSVESQERNLVAAIADRRYRVQDERYSTIFDANFGQQDLAADEALTSVYLDQAVVDITASAGNDITASNSSASGVAEPASSPTASSAGATGISSGATLHTNEPVRVRTHRDLMLEELQWLAKDMSDERKWKIVMAKKLSQAVLKHFEQKQKRIVEEAIADEMRRRRRALRIASHVSKMWSQIDKLVIFKHKSRLDAMRRMAMDKHLNFLVGQTERYSQMLATNVLAAGSDVEAEGGAGVSESVRADSVHESGSVTTTAPSAPPLVRGTSPLPTPPNEVSVGEGTQPIVQGMDEDAALGGMEVDAAAALQEKEEDVQNLKMLVNARNADDADEVEGSSGESDFCSDDAEGTEDDEETIEEEERRRREARVQRLSRRPRRAAAGASSAASTVDSTRVSADGEEDGEEVLSGKEEEDALAREGEMPLEEFKRILSNSVFCSSSSRVLISNCLMMKFSSVRSCTTVNTPSRNLVRITRAYLFSTGL